MNAWVDWVIQTGIMISIGIITYFIKELRATIEEQIDENKSKLDFLEKEFNSFKTDMPFVYVMREDFIRSMENVEQKLDKIYDHITKGASNI